MTPAAIRAAEGPALDAFVLERVCGWRRHMNEDGGLLWNCVFSDRPGQYFLTPKHAEVSTSDAACWRWVVPALRERGWMVGVESSLVDPGVWYGTLGHVRHDTVLVEAPTPALAIVRAAALTVAEGGE